MELRVLGSGGAGYAVLGALGTREHLAGRGGHWHRRQTASSPQDQLAPSTSPRPARPAQDGRSDARRRKGRMVRLGRLPARGLFHSCHDDVAAPGPRGRPARRLGVPHRHAPAAAGRWLPARSEERQQHPRRAESHGRRALGRRDARSAERQQHPRRADSHGRRALGRRGARSVVTPSLLGLGHAGAPWPASPDGLDGLAGRRERLFMGRRPAVAVAVAPVPLPARPWLPALAETASRLGRPASVDSHHAFIRRRLPLLRSRLWLDAAGLPLPWRRAAATSEARAEAEADTEALVHAVDCESPTARPRDLGCL